MERRGTGRREHAVLRESGTRPMPNGRMKATTDSVPVGIAPAGERAVHQYRAFLAAIRNPETRRTVQVATERLFRWAEVALMTHSRRRYGLIEDG